MSLSKGASGKTVKKYSGQLRKKRLVVLTQIKIAEAIGLSTFRFTNKIADPLNYYLATN